MKHSFLPLLIGLLCWTGSQAATRTYAYDGSKTQAENGTALQAAINAASSGDELKVQAGTYYGNFTMKEGVNVSGGWNSTFDAQTDYATILDAQSEGRVLEQPANFTTLTVWSNFTIQNGNLKAISATPANGLSSGVALGKKGQVKHCLIQNNTFSYNGNCMGGGVGNDAIDAATDVCAEDCIIRGNSGTHGGGVRVRGTVLNCIIENNNTTNDVKKGPAGGVHLQSGRLVGCIVRGNKSGGDTGGIRCYGKCQVINCLVIDNVATGKVGGIGIESANSDIIGCTIVGNDQLINNASDNTKCGLSCGATSDNGTKLANNIIWGNKHNGVEQETQIYYVSHYSATNRINNAVTNQLTNNDGSCIRLSQNNTEDGTCIDGSGDEQPTYAPHFADPTNGDYRLTWQSPMLNKGQDALTTVTADLDGNMRISGTTVDIGCYEYQYPVLTDNYVHSDEDLQEAIDATSAGTTVYVQAGTYYGNFTMKDGVNVSGGWNEDFTSQTDYATILDAQENGRVVNQPSDFTTLTIWSNLTIQHGKLASKQSDELGSGVALMKKGQVKHCLIQNNTFDYDGNCLGGGVGNKSVTANTDILIDDCLIRNNCGTHGGGVRIQGTIQNSIIENNNTKDVKAGPAGGAHLQGGRMVNCIVRGNTSGGDCGGVRLYNKCQLINTLVVGNTATGKVGGVGIESANSDVIGCTIVGNDQLTSNAGDNSKCGISCGATSDNGTKLANNIVWGNKHNGVAQTAQIYYISHYNAANRINNAIAHQNTTNGVKLSMDNDADDTYTDSDSNEQTGRAPHFADPANGDYRLTWQSPMFNKGNNDLTTVTEDLDGDTRTKGGVVDCGCYEFDAVTVSISNTHAVLTVRGSVCEGSSVAVPKGYNGTANVVAEDGYIIVSATLNGSPIVTDGEGNFSVPALNADASIAITAKELTYYNRSVTEGRMGTICLPYAVPSGAIAGAQVYKVISFATEEKAGLLLEEVNTMAAGIPYFFMPNADEVTFAYIAEGEAATDGKENGLYGTIEGKAVSGEGYYVLQNNLLCPTYNAATSEAIEVTLAANRAYLKFDEVPAASGAAPAPGRRVLGIQQAQNTPTAIGSLQYETGVQKVLRDGQLLIIRDGKTYNMLGL